MHANKFSVGGLKGVHISSIIIEAIETNSKISQEQFLAHKKHATSKNQWFHPLRSFRTQKLLRGWRSLIFTCGMFFIREQLFLKIFWNCLDSLTIYIKKIKYIYIYNIYIYNIYMYVCMYIYMYVCICIFCIMFQWEQ